MNKKQLKAARKFTDKLHRKCEKLAQEFGLSTDIQIEITAYDSDTVINCNCGAEVKKSTSAEVRQLLDAIEELVEEDEEMNPFDDLILGYIAGKEYKKDYDLTVRSITRGLDMQKETVKATLAKLVELGELTKSGSRYRTAIKSDKDGE